MLVVLVVTACSSSTDVSVAASAAPTTTTVPTTALASTTVAPPATSPPTTGTTVTDLHSVDWANITVNAAACLHTGTVQLRDGRVLIQDDENGSPQVPDGSGPNYVALIDDPASVVYADEDGDGSDEAFVGLGCSNLGGTADGALLDSIDVFVSGPQGPRELGLITPQRQPENALPTLLSEPVVTRDRIVVHETWYGRDDGTCCPSGSSTTTWTITDGHLAAIDTTDIATPAP
jgi:hypothetical protein